jgi:hypothetical protein
MSFHFQKSTLVVPSNPYQRDCDIYIYITWDAEMSHKFSQIEYP